MSASLKGGTWVGRPSKAGQINGGHGFPGWVCADCWCGCGRDREVHDSNDNCYALASGLLARLIHPPEGQLTLDLDLVTVHCFDHDCGHVVQGLGAEA